MVERERFYYKEVSHMIMEAEKLHGLQLASWRPRKADGVSVPASEDR